MSKKLQQIGLLMLVLVLSSCSDDPVSNDEDHEHAEAVGLIIRNSGTEIVRYEDGAVSGEIEVGEALQTALLSIRFIDEDGDLFTPTDEDFSLDWEIADTEVAEVIHHDEDGDWRFHIHGKKLGATTIRIKINHLDHADFVSQEIEIHVSVDGGGEDLEDEHDHEDEDHEDDE